MNVKVINKSKHQLPKYTTQLSAGMDLRANIDADMILKPLQRLIIKTAFLK